MFNLLLAGTPALLNARGTGTPGFIVGPIANELINSIRDDNNEEFRRKYRNIDVLLIEDIQFR